MAIALLAVFVARVQAQAPVPPVESFKSSGKWIRLERFAPADPGHHPAIFVLYGASGLTRRGEAFRNYSRSLAAHGFVAFLIHYFDANDSATSGDLPVSSAHFQLWSKALQDGISYAAKDAQVDRHRIGLLGFSLGAFLAVWEASQDTRIKAVSEYYGGASMFLGPAKRMPATLILHGEKDSFIPVEEAHQLERLLQRQHAPYEIKIYPGQEHGFDGPEGDPEVTRDAWQRTLAFLDKHLAAR